MSSYDGVSFEDLDLDGDTFVEDDEEGTAIGTLSGFDPESTLSVVTGAGKVKIVDDELQVGPDANTDGTLNISVRETNANGEGGSHDTAFALTVTAAT
jgi:hypothetical protein